MTDDARRYLCVNCDLAFDAPNEDEARCPRCMRKNVVEQPRHAAIASGRPKWAIASAMGVVTLGLVLGYVAWSRSRPAVVGTTVPDAPLDASEYRGHLRRLGADRPDVRSIFDATSDVRALFRTALREADDGHDGTAEAIRDVLVDLGRRHRLVNASPRGARRGAFLAAGPLARALRARSGNVEASSIEVVLLATAALRAADIDARVVEVWGYEGGGVPDASGLAGHFFVEVPGAGSNSARVLVEILPDGDATHVAERGAYRVLDDIEAAAAALTVQAMVSAARDHDSQAALDAVDTALRLDPRSATARTVRATILASTGALDQAMDEARAAEAIRADPPRLLFIASLLLSSGDAAAAEPLIRRAAEAAPELGSAHAMLASLALARRETDVARTELETAERNDPTNEALPSLWAGYFILTGNPEEAVRRIDAMVEAHPREPMIRMQAAYSLMQGRMQDRAIVQLRAAVDMTESSERDALLEQIGRAFGLEVLGELVGPPDAGGVGDVPENSESVGSADGELRLDMPNLGAGRTQRPSILAP